MPKDDEEFDDVEFSGGVPLSEEDEADEGRDLEEDNEEDLAGEDEEDLDAEDNDTEDDTEDETASSAGEGQDHKGRKKRSAQDRIKELARARRESERAAYEAELRALELEQELASRGDRSDEPELPKAPDPKSFRYGEVDPDYIDALVEYRVAKREHDGRAERLRREQEAATESENAKYRRRLAEVMEQGVKKYRGFKESVDNTVYDPALARLVLDSDNAVDIAYHLSKNVADLRALTRASQQERLRMLGRLEGKLSAASAVKKKTVAPQTPGGRNTSRNDRSTGKYGPENQDEFDKAFFGR